ncbi:nuclear factor NF-kappa-B p105 subunit-like [Porites lutea]|uniref:nuclear factor NF-kappa-B p105 subunit-like n=1 Tax=Porites lutea TaxID=51062 RepID=UPI003CC6A5C0
MATNSERQIGETLTDSLLIDILTPGYLPDVSALQVPPTAYQGPYLEILEQPKQRGFRFRYPCEGPSHGGLPGQYSEKGKKSYPSVQLSNYHGPARIVVSLVTVSEPYMPHAHSLIGKNSNDGVVTVQIGPEQGMTASFPNLGIQHVTRKSVSKVLMDRYLKLQTLHTATLNALSVDSKGFDADAAMRDQGLADGDLSEFNKNMAEAIAAEESHKVLRMVEEQKTNMNLSAVRLCFQAYLPDESGCFTKALPPCISDPVYDSKAPSASNLKICRMDRNSGCVTGNDEVYLLCDKVQKDDIEVVFYETDPSTGKRSWEAQGVFSPTDVHRQVAIVFKTPAYWNVATENPVKVHLELRRKSDQETSEPVEFTYQPQMFDKEQIGAKRRKKIPHFSDYFPGGGGGPPSVGGAGGGGFAGFTGFGLFPTFNFMGLQPSNQGDGSGTSQQGQSTSSGQTHMAEQSSRLPESEVSLNELAWNLAEKSAAAMRDYATSGDVRYLLAVQRHLTAVQDDNGDTALHLAVINSQQEVIQCLVEVMAGLPETFVNEFNFLRQTPLHLAAITKQPHALDCLLRAGANPRLRDRHGNTVVHIACTYGDGACLKALLNHSAPKTVLNLQNYQGLTPVHLAVLSGSKDALKLLNTAGANLSAQDGTSGKTPLHYAVEQDNLPLAGFLILEGNCDVDASSFDGNTALHLAAGYGLKGQTALLVAAGADTSLQNSDEETAFDLANVAEVQEILDEDEALSTDPSQDISAGVAKIKLGQGDLDKLDPYVRRKMAQRLDISTVANWRELARRLKLGTLERAFEIHTSPTIQVLAEYEAAEGTIENLSKVLEEMRRGDVLDILQGRHDSGFDSGFGSQSLSFNKSEELTSYGAGISDVSSGSSLRKEKATFDPSRKAGHFRPNRQHQDVF